jgi:LPXTG-site transpeptidase (sortase) family protein
MKRWRSGIVVASVITAIAVLAVTGGPFPGHPSGRHASSHDARETGRATIVVGASTPATIAEAEPPSPLATVTPPADRTTVVASSSPAATIARTDPPSAEATVPPPDQPLNDPTQASAPATTEYVLDIESIDLHEPVVAGGQDEIDQGFVTAVDWSSQGYPASCLPGAGCTVWLAGHRSTHQAVFARLPEIAAGALIEIHFHGEAFAYTVTDAVTVPGTSPPSVIHGDLVLQTTASDGQRILIYAAAVKAP